MKYLPTYLTAFIFLCIYTAQVYTNIGKSKKSNNLLYFVALTLFMALINLLFNDRVAGFTLVTAITAWLVGVIIVSFWPADIPSVLPKCSSSAPPACPPEPPCPQNDCGCDGGCTNGPIQCIDLHL